MTDERPVGSHGALRARHERDPGRAETAVHLRRVHGARDDGLPGGGLRRHERVRVLGAVEADVDRDGARDLGRLEDEAHARLEAGRLHLGRHVDGIPVGAEVRQVGAEGPPPLVGSAGTRRPAASAASAATTEGPPEIVRIAIARSRGGRDAWASSVAIASNSSSVSSTATMPPDANAAR